MNHIHYEFSNHFRCQWIKVTFYKEKPTMTGMKRLKNVRFCEAVKEAVSYPILLDQKSINCMGAQYAFGWQDKNVFLEHCRQKTTFTETTLQSLLKQMPRLKQGYEWIGLNTEGIPDMILARMTPKNAMNLIDLYQTKTGHILNVSLCSMMSICGGIAVRTFLENRITFSFGCEDSRKYAQIGRDHLVLGIPKNQYTLVQDTAFE